MVVEGSHEAIIDRETGTSSRGCGSTNAGAPTWMSRNKYSGLVVCADCGATMVLHRSHTMKPTQNNFTCRTYKRFGKEVCAAHYIRECVLDEIVLEDIRQVTALAREQTQAFAAYICDPPVCRAPAGDPQAGVGTVRHAKAERGTGGHLQAAV